MRGQGRRTRMVGVGVAGAAVTLRSLDAAPAGATARRGAANAAARPIIEWSLRRGSSTRSLFCSWHLTEAVES